VTSQHFYKGELEVTNACGTTLYRQSINRSFDPLG
jgi:hypothetical protein